MRHEENHVVKARRALERTKGLTLPNGPLIQNFVTGTQDSFDTIVHSLRAILTIQGPVNLALIKTLKVSDMARATKRKKCRSWISLSSLASEAINTTEFLWIKKILPQVTLPILVLVVVYPKSNGLYTWRSIKNWIQLKSFCQGPWNEWKIDGTESV